MSDAAQLIASIRRDLEPLDDRIRSHPYIAALKAGTVERDSLGVFAGQQYHIISSDLRSIAHLISRHGTLPSRTFLMNTLQGEAAALEALPAFGAAVGVSEDDLRRFEPIPAGHAYCAYVAWIGLYGSDAELAGAFVVNFAAWGANCGSMSRALQQEYGFSLEQVAFLELFANVPPFEDEAVAVIDAALERGVTDSLVHRAARLLQGYELMFWDAMAAAANVETP